MVLFATLHMTNGKKLKSQKIAWHWPLFVSKAGYVPGQQSTFEISPNYPVMNVLTIWRKQTPLPPWDSLLPQPLSALLRHSVPYGVLRFLVLTLICQIPFVSGEESTSSRPLRYALHRRDIHNFPKMVCC